MLVRLQQRYDVSLELAVRAWVHVQRRGAGLFYWSESDPRPTLQWAGAAAPDKVQLDHARIAARKNFLVFINRSFHLKST